MLTIHITDAGVKYMWFGMLLVLLSAASQVASQPVVSVKKTDYNKGVYYTIRPDLRRCAAPLCGGYWLSAVNHKATRCVDGSRQKECYVAEIAWDEIGLGSSAGASLVLGDLQEKAFEGFGGLGLLSPSKVWRAASKAAPKGTWYGLKDNGIRCITSPCYTIDERTLNRKRTQKVSGVDFSEIDPSTADGDVEAAEDALSKSELIAVGNNVVVPDEGPAGDGLALVATQFFLEIPSKPNTNTNLSCKVDSDCTLTVYHSFVSSPDECYCPLCPEPLDARSARNNEQSWQKHCRNFGFEMSGNIGAAICPQVLCIAPEPVGCVKNQCVFLTDNPLEKVLQ